MWVKGQSGNPAGRPKGSRHKLQTSFWNDLHRVWKDSGADALRRVARDDPSTFVRVCASLMPKEEAAKQVEHAIEITLKRPEWLKPEGTNLPSSNKLLRKGKTLSTRATSFWPV